MDTFLNFTSESDRAKPCFRFQMLCLSRQQFTDSGKQSYIIPQDLKTRPVLQMKRMYTHVESVFCGVL